MDLAEPCKQQKTDSKPVYSGQIKREGEREQQNISRFGQKLKVFLDYLRLVYKLNNIDSWKRRHNRRVKGWNVHNFPSGSNIFHLILFGAIERKQLCNASTQLTISKSNTGQEMTWRSYPNTTKSKEVRGKKGSHLTSTLFSI